MIPSGNAPVTFPILCVSRLFVSPNDKLPVGWKGSTANPVWGHKVREKCSSPKPRECKSTDPKPQRCAVLQWGDPQHSGNELGAPDVKDHWRHGSVRGKSPKFQVVTILINATPPSLTRRTASGLPTDQWKPPGFRSVRSQQSHSVSSSRHVFFLLLS